MSSSVLQSESRNARLRTSSNAPRRMKSSAQLPTSRSASHTMSKNAAHLVMVQSFASSRVSPSVPGCSVSKNLDACQHLGPRHQQAAGRFCGDKRKEACRDNSKGWKDGTDQGKEEKRCEEK